MTPAPHDYPISSRLPAAPSRRLRVVVTGATGYIASQLLPAFRQRYELALLDVRATDRAGRPVAGVQTADLLAEDWPALRAHFRGAGAVVHLGYHRPAGTGVTGAGKGYLDERPNVDMAERVYRLALEEGVRRSARVTCSNSSSARSRRSASTMSGASPSRSFTASPTTPAPSGASPTRGGSSGTPRKTIQRRATPTTSGVSCSAPDTTAAWAKTKDVTRET